MLIVQIVSDKQDIYLQQKFENINDEIEKEIKEIEKKHRACNLYLKEKSKND